MILNIGNAPVTQREQVLSSQITAIYVVDENRGQVLIVVIGDDDRNVIALKARKRRRRQLKAFQSDA